MVTKTCEHYFSSKHNYNNNNNTAAATVITSDVPNLKLVKQTPLQ